MTADLYKPDRNDSPLDPCRCKAWVWSNERWSRYSQCARKPVQDGWCKQHDPAAVAERRVASDAKGEAETRKWAMGFHGERWLVALAKIRDGDNDARETARVALEGCMYAPKDQRP